MTSNTNEFNTPGVEIVTIASITSSDAEEGREDVTELPSFGSDAEDIQDRTAVHKCSNKTLALAGTSALLVACVTGVSAVALKRSESESKRVVSNAIKAAKTPKRGLQTNPTILGSISTSTTSSCAVAAAGDYAANNYAACSRYFGSPQSSTCDGTASYLSNPSGNTPPNGNPGDNTCLGMGDAPYCIDLDGFDEPVPVRISAAWDWSEYLPPSSVNSNTCGVSNFPFEPGTACARILTNSSIPVKSSAGGRTTGACYGIVGGLPTVVTPGIAQISSTVTITLSGTDYVCEIVEGGKLCEMWGYRSGYGNNFDSQYIPFECDDIAGDAYVGYFSNVFDHNQLQPITEGIGQAAQFVLQKVD